MKLNLRTKLIGSFVIVLLLMIVVGLVGVYTSKYIQDHLQETVEQEVKAANILGVVARRTGFIHSNALLHLITRSIDDMDRYESEVADWVGRIDTDLDTLENTFKDQATLDKLAEFRVAWETYLRIWNEQVVPLSRANRDDEAFALVRKEGVSGTAAQEMMYKLDELHDALIATADESLELAEQDFGRGRYILLTVTLLAIILGLAFGIKQSSLIADAVNTVSKAAQRVAAGDLDQSVTLKTGDEIEAMADSFNTMTGNMKKMVEELRHEITERCRAEKALQESEEWLSTTLRSIGDAVIATDAQGLVTLMNPVAEDLTGWDEAETVGKPLEDVLHIINEQTGQPAENPVAKVLREGVVVGLANHTVLIARDGTKRPIADSGAPMRDEEGDVLGTVMVFRDITEAKQAEEELRESEERLDLAVKGTGVGLWDWMVQTGETVFSEKWAEIVGYTLEELSPASIETWIKLTHPDDLKRSNELLERHFAGETEYYECEARMKHKSGEWIWILDRGKVFERDKDGKPIRMTGTHLDITETKEIQARLVRTEKLAVLGQLSGGVGHELRNPLGVISNAVYFLQMTLSDADETTSEYLGIISSEVRTAEKIVSDLLDFSRVKSLEREEIALSDLIDQVLEKQPPPEKVEVNTEIPSELPPVFVDSRQIVQVLLNLVVNGYQAMPEGGELKITTRAEKSRVNLYITDTGCGISKENLKKIFEPLFTTRARGIGLGLAVSKNLMETNGGSLVVESEEGKGTTFTVILPTKEEGN